MDSIASALAAKAGGEDQYDPANDSAQEVSDAIHAKDAKRLAAALKEHYAFTQADEPTPITSTN